MLKKLFTFCLLIALSTQGMAQCAMCRATLENNLSAGNPGIGAGINFGILYLFFTPYIAVGVIAYLWYRTTRKNGIKFSDSNLAR